MYWRNARMTKLVLPLRHRFHPLHNKTTLQRRVMKGESVRRTQQPLDLFDVLTQLAFKCSSLRSQRFLLPIHNRSADSVPNKTEQAHKERKGKHSKGAVLAGQISNAISQAQPTG